MTSIENLCARTTYVLQVIERSLGEFSTAKAELLEASVLDTAAEGASNKSFQDRVSESYLGDLFGLALKACHGTAAYSEVLHLKVLSESLGIYEIRNACAHPNRPFFPHYWYRVASLAQDPSFRVLGIEKVGEALANAESDSFSTADLGWTITLKRVVPNNLPLPFEHDRTGLIGRDQLIEQCAKLLVSGRFPTVALVAPGGLGKTALGLEVLKKVAYSSAASDFEAVIFVSLKTQRLTVSGVQIYESIPKIEDLERRLSSAISSVFVDEADDEIGELFEAVQTHGARRLLICIDNLEDVLLAQANDFEVLLASLPQTWRVLITTRVPLNSAHCLTLGALLPPAAGNLGMGYSRVIGLRLAREVADRIALVCKYNPLAIKLTIDAVAAGKDIESALSSATSGTLKFSYGLLLDSLSKDCVIVLEVLFAAGTLTRSDIALVLDIEAEHVAQSLGVLSRTSLLHFILESGVERYLLNDAVRELLRINPVNLGLRTEISQKVAKRRQKDDSLLSESIRSGENNCSIYYVPKEHPAALREISRLIKRGKQEDVEAALYRLTMLELDCQQVDTYWLLKAAALAKFRDPQAEQAACRALEIEESIRAVGWYAYWLQSVKRYPESADRYQRLKELGGCRVAVVGDYLGERNIRGMLISLLFSGQYEDVIELTREFLLDGYKGETLCMASAAAARNLFAKERDIVMLEECIDVLRVGFIGFGYTPILAKEGFKLVRDFWVHARAGRLSEEAMVMAASFVCDHYQHIYAAAPASVVMEDGWVTTNLIDLALGLKMEDSRREVIFELCGMSGESRTPTLTSIPVTICDFFYDPAMSYRFALDREGLRHYLRIEDFEGGGPEWRCLLPKMQVYIVPGLAPLDTSDCPRAEKVSLRPIFLDAKGRNP